MSDTYSQEADYKMFSDNIDALMERYGGRFVVIHNQAVVKDVPTMEEAISFGIDQYRGCFIAQEVRLSEPAIVSYSLLAHPRSPVINVPEEELTGQEKEDLMHTVSTYKQQGPGAFTPHDEFVKELFGG